MNAPPTRVGIVGPLLGSNPGWPVSQGEILAAHLTDDGMVVRTTSGLVPRVRRVVDTFHTITSWRDEVDVLVVLTFSGPAFSLTDLARRVGSRLDVPLVLWLHGGNLPRFAARHRRWAHSVLSSADRIVAPSRYLAAMSEGLGHPADIIPNTIPTVTGGHRPRRLVRPRLLWMRTFHPLYQPALAVEVVDVLRELVPGVVLTMAGQDKGELEATRELVQRLGLQDHVRFVGFLDDARKAQAFAENDLFINTTRTDNAPVSLLEAAAHGLPIVSTPAGGITDLFTEGDDALLASSAAGLAGAVARLLADPVLTERLSGAGIALAANATWPNVGPQWHRLLHEITHSRARRRSDREERGTRRPPGSRGPTGDGQS